MYYYPYLSDQTHQTRYSLHFLLSYYNKNFFVLHVDKK